MDLRRRIEVGADVPGKHAGHDRPLFRRYLLRTKAYPRLKIASGSLLHAGGRVSVRLQLLQACRLDVVHEHKGPAFSRIWLHVDVPAVGIPALHERNLRHRLGGCQGQRPFHLACLLAVERELVAPAAHGPKLPAYGFSCIVLHIFQSFIPRATRRIRRCPSQCAAARGHFCVCSVRRPSSGARPRGHPDRARPLCGPLIAGRFRV